MAIRFNLPPLTRGLIIGLVLLTSLNAAARYRSWQVDRTDILPSRAYYAPYIVIVPGMSIVYPWVFAIATLAEQNIFGLLITGAVILYGGRYLERAWGSSEYLKFIAIVSIIPNAGTFIIYALLYSITRNTSLSSTSISGGIAIQAGFLVAFKQLVPEHTVSVMKGLIRVRVKHFPAMFLLANTIAGLFLGTDTAMALGWLGFFASWVYLRFYRLSPSLVSAATGETANIRGDASDTFAFAYFFPDAVHAPIAQISSNIYDLLVVLRLCTPFSREDVDASNEQAAARGEGGLPGLLNPHSKGGRGSERRAEAERRRALALRALDQRLNAAVIRQPAPAAQVASGHTSLGETTYEPEDSSSSPRPAPVASEV